MIEIGSVVFEKKTFKIRQCYFAISLLSPLVRGVALHLNKIESLLPSHALGQVLLKLAQWFWRRRRKYKKFTTTTTKDKLWSQKTHLCLRPSWAKNERGLNGYLIKESNGAQKLRFSNSDFRISLHNKALNLFKNKQNFTHLRYFITEALKPHISFSYTISQAMELTKTKVYNSRLRHPFFTFNTQFFSVWKSLGKKKKNNAFLPLPI